MQRVRYVGPHRPGVEIQIKPPKVEFVAYGGTIEVPGELAGNLVQQEGVWVAVGADARAELLREAIAGLPASAAEALVKRGHTSPDAVFALSDEELAAIDGVGPASVTAIAAARPGKSPSGAPQPDGEDDDA